MAEMFNPFAELPKRLLDAVVSQRAEQKAAQKRYDDLLSAYRAMLDDPRYQAAQQEFGRVLREELITLIDHAAACPRCAVRAVRVKLLREIITLPIHEVLLSGEQDRMADSMPDGHDHDAHS